MEDISPLDLNLRIQNGEEIQIIDIREEHEIAVCTINGLHIPMAEILERRNEIRLDIPVVIHCRSGQRSAAVIHTLNTKFQFSNLLNLQGGIVGWAQSVDSSLEIY
ncbi:MAG: rhodanese-related sulfurtransferase [Flavobacteriales bacterium]|jgi:rhodanese-related sulfurtransferase